MPERADRIRQKSTPVVGCQITLAVVRSRIKKNVNNLDNSAKFLINFWQLAYRRDKDKQNTVRNE